MKRSKRDLVARINHALRIRPDQIDSVDAIVQIHEDKIREIRNDKSIGKEQKAQEIRDNLESLVPELTPMLTHTQLDDLKDFLYNATHPGVHANIAVDFLDYMPENSVTRSIFGRSLTAFGIGFGGDEHVGDRSRLEFGLDIFEMPSYSNKLFVISPQAAYELRVPFARGLYAFAVGSVGPAYMDYTYDLPDDQHFSGKRFGVDGSFEVGVQCGPLRLGVAYRAFTQPSGLDFDGVELSAALTVLRF